MSKYETVVEFLTNRGRPVHKWVHYFPIYERHFAPFVNRPTTLIEIGVSKGGSLQLWERYLGPFAAPSRRRLARANCDFGNETIAKFGGVSGSAQVRCKFFVATRCRLFRRIWSTTV